MSTLQNCIALTQQERQCQLANASDDHKRDECVQIIPRIECLRNKLEASRAIKDFLSTFPIRDVKLTDVLLTVFALLQIALFYRQAKTMDKQAEIMGQQAQFLQQQTLLAQGQTAITNRPKIIVRDFHIDHLSVNDPVSLVFNISNIGEGVAFSIRVAVTVWVQEGNDVLQYSVNNVRAAASFGEFVAPNGIWHRIRFHPNTLQSGEVRPFVCLSPKPILGGQHDGIFSGATLLSCYGEIYYQDQRSVTRRTGFRRDYDFSKKTFVPADDPEWEYAY